MTTSGASTTTIPLVTSGCGPLTSADLQLGQTNQGRRGYTEDQEREIMRNALTGHDCSDNRF